MKWSQPNISGKAPKKRYQHTAVLYQRNKLVIHGGISKMTALQDVFILDLGIFFKFFVSDNQRKWNG
jgi:hypothetical protein